MSEITALHCCSHVSTSGVGPDALPGRGPTNFTWSGSGGGGGSEGSGSGSGGPPKKGGSPKPNDAASSSKANDSHGEIFNSFPEGIFEQNDTVKVC